MAIKDDLAPLITGCPNCDTRFRVTESQLQVAKGQVRCGACLQVFDGTSHLVQDGEALGAAEAEDVDALLSELENEIDQPPDQIDELAPLNPETDTEQEPELELIELGPTHAADDAGTLERTTAPSGQPNDVNMAHDPEAEARLKALEDELMADLKGVLSTSEAMPIDEPPETDQEAADTNAPDRVPEGVSAIIQEPESTAEKAGLTDAGLTEEATRTEVEAEVPEPIGSGHVEIELTSAEPEPPPVQDIPAELLQDDEVPKRGWGTWAVMVLALIALPVQVLWFQYDEWVKDDTMRPLYGFVCDVVGCELPVRRNVGLIVAKQSVLRDHPEEPQAMIIDALLVNHATYDQPYPIIELTLMDINEIPVASRRFQPNEYLAGEASSHEFMQQRAPVHISLELKKPERATPSFKIRFLPTGK